MLAGLPKAPSGYNPYLHPKRAIARQMEVLRDMQRYGFIEESVYKQALNQPLRFKASRQSRDLSADYVAEMVRESLYATYQDEIYSSGLKVYTTVRKTNQEAANSALRDGILDYDARQGYRGAEKLLILNSVVTDADKEEITEALSDIDVSNGLVPAAITKISEKSITVHTKYGDDVEINGKGLALIQNTLNEKKPEKRLLKVGAVIRIVNSSPSTQSGQWRVTQLPQVESALISIDPETGAIRALVGGFDFNRNKFNHVTQAWRQPGSSFKPFIYSAALEKGYTPATIVEDAPLSFSPEETGNKEWTPQNYDATFDGPIRLRQALAKSKNMVAIRVLDSIGPAYAQDYITRFGFAAKNHPAYMTMALGAGSATPMQMASAYAVFANGGYRVNPYLISKIVDQNGKVISQSKFVTARNDAPRVIDARNAFIMNSMMQDVVRYGTAAKASQLGRSDLAGKTGTTNDHYDAWFTGYSPKLVAVTWVGFDKPRRLGRNETGGSTALPIWIKYMASALRNVPQTDMPVPDGVMALRIDPTTGIRADNDENGIYEYFYHENPPPEVETELPGMLEGGGEALPLSQPQQMLQPDITLLPRKESGANKTAKPADAANGKESNTHKATDQVQQLLNPH